MKTVNNTQEAKTFTRNKKVVRLMKKTKQWQIMTSYGWTPTLKMHLKWKLKIE